jgi:hypothetical protein
MKHQEIYVVIRTSYYYYYYYYYYYIISSNCISIHRRLGTLIQLNNSKLSLNISYSSFISAILLATSFMPLPVGYITIFAYVIELILFKIRCYIMQSIQLIAFHFYRFSA